MRSFKEFAVDLVRKPPVLFPLVGLFHLLWLFYTIWDDRMEPLSSKAWLQVLWMAAFSFFWLAATDLRKWGAWGYFALTLVDCAIFFAVKNHTMSVLYLCNLFLVDVLFSFFLLVYYKRMR